MAESSGVEHGYWEGKYQGYREGTPGYRGGRGRGRWGGDNWNQGRGGGGRYIQGRWGRNREPTISENRPQSNSNQNKELAKKGAETKRYEEVQNNKTYRMPDSEPIEIQNPLKLALRLIAI